MGIVFPILSLVVGFFSGWFFTRFTIAYARRRGLLGVDMHKPDHPRVPEFGGAGFVLGAVFGAILLAFLATLLETTESVAELVTVVSAVGLAGFLGMLSDVFKFPWRINALLPVSAALPLLPVVLSAPYIVFPLVGSVYLGGFYLLLLLLGATGAANAVNMVAGYNGLEAGMSAAILATLAVLILISGSPGLVPALLLLGAILGFLYWNWYPAKTFPGDVGTWSFGVAIFAVSVVSKLEFWAVPLFFIHFVNLYLFLRHKEDIVRHGEKFAQVLPDGTLTAKTDGSIYFWLVRRFRMTERDIVRILTLTQIAVCATVVGICALTCRL